MAQSVRVAGGRLTPSGVAGGAACPGPHTTATWSESDGVLRVTDSAAGATIVVFARAAVCLATTESENSSMPFSVGIAWFADEPPVLVLARTAADGSMRLDSLAEPWFWLQTSPLPVPSNDDVNPPLPDATSFMADMVVEGVAAKIIVFPDATCTSPTGETASIGLVAKATRAYRLALVTRDTTDRNKWHATVPGRVPETVVLTHE